MSSSRKRHSINDIQLPSTLVKGLSLAVLKDLSKQDEATFYQFFEGLNLEEIKRVRERSQEIQEKNKELAARNIELKPAFEKAKSNLMLKTNELNTLKEEYDKKLLELKAIQSKVNHQAVEKELAQAARKTEQESDDMASDFVGGKSSLSLEDFKEGYIEQRTLYWLRRVKSEKMKELVQSYRPVPAPRTVHQNATPTPNSVSASNVVPPYPIPQNPHQSLQPKHVKSTYPEPAASLPPYPTQSAMPVPSRETHPFPAAAFSYSRPVPVRPPAYSGSSLNQHRL